MGSRSSIYAAIAAVLFLLTACPSVCRAQFKQEAFKQSYTDPSDTTAMDSTQVMFSFKEYFGGLKHTRDARIGVVVGGSSVFIGGAQIYNRQYWKLPVIYGAIGAGVGGGLVYRRKWQQEGSEDFRRMSNWFFAGAGLAYWGALMDGTVNYRKDIPVQAGKATLYSLLLPGLGQAYNGEYWKIPIYYGCLLGSVHFYSVNRRNYQRYKWIYDQATNPDIQYDGPVQESTAKYYRDVYRRYRDYSVLAIAGFYLLQVIDANIFSYMRDFDLSDDIELSLSPAVITDTPAYSYDQYALSTGCRTGYPGTNSQGFGLRLGLTF